jgi:hypothetical protein
MNDEMFFPECIAFDFLWIVRNVYCALGFPTIMQTSGDIVIPGGGAKHLAISSVNVIVVVLGKKQRKKRVRIIKYDKDNSNEVAGS